MKIPHRYEQFDVFPDVIKWLLIASVIGIFAGLASALFLKSLDRVTHWREQHVWIIACLPVAGLVVGWTYHKIGKDVEAGNNLILDEVHDPQHTIPLLMAPLILVSSIVTHLFGGSAGREGTAVQMGGSLADQLCRPLGLSKEDRRIVLMAGLSGGFASVFGTPLAGTVFGLEVLAIGRLRYEALFPCLVASIVGHWIAALLGVQHTMYKIPLSPNVTPVGLCWAVVAGILFGIVGMLFAKAAHGVDAAFKKNVSYPPLRPFIGGIVVALLVFLTQSTRYIGLGLPVIHGAFDERLPPWDFAGKFFTTVLTLGSGFKGGEVTPLFFIGATLGNALSRLIPLPMPLLAGMGFSAIFAGAANVPLACTLMGIELFGHESAIYMAVACVSAYLFSGHAGIYHSQRIGSSKHRSRQNEEGMSLKDLAARERSQ